MSPTRTLWAIAHHMSSHASGYDSSFEMACHVGVGRDGSQSVCDVIRKIMADCARKEQDDFHWEPGSLIEADEASIRVKRIPCERSCTIRSCGDHAHGKYRLLHYRFLCIMPRGRRDLAMFFELPHKTCEAGGSGVPLKAAEWDQIGPRVLAPGPYTLLTDGAGAYQSVAPLDRVAYHTVERGPDSWSKSRYERYYKKLKLSHGIVSHKAEQWAEKDSVSSLHYSC